MGSPATEKDRLEGEGPQHEVTIVRPFAVSKFEVTFDQWDACIQYGGCTRVGSPFGGGKQPAINVIWDEAQEYMNWLSGLTGQSYRLLAEAEWEYAARAGTTSPYSFEGDESALGEYAWYKNNSGNRAHPVGEKKPNAFGLYDVHGNVFEWVEDCYHESYDRAPTDGSAWTSGNCSIRLLRGGPGTPILGTSARPTATGAPPTTGAAVWASGSGGRWYLLESLPLYFWDPRREAC